MNVMSIVTKDNDDDDDDDDDCLLFLSIWFLWYISW
jgi:hypothetical protein